MAFEQKIVVELLKLFDNFPVELFLRSTEIDHSQWEELIPESIEQYPAETILWHLYLMSQSNLISPQIGLEEVRGFLNNEASENQEPVFWILKNILPKHTITIQGNEYIQKHM